MRLIVSGAREGFHQRQIDEVLDGYRVKYGDSLVIIEGCAKGVDTQAFEWAKRNRVPVWHQPAPWDHLGKPAGRWRNRAMLRMAQMIHPDDTDPEDPNAVVFPQVAVVCFHPDIQYGSRGTRDMALVAAEAGIAVHLVGSTMPLL